MRSGQLDECFDKREQEWLVEFVEANLGHELEALEAMREEKIDDVVTPENYVAHIADQQAKIKFLQFLYECLT